MKWHSDPDAAYEKTIAIDASVLEPVATVGYKARPGEKA